MINIAMCYKEHEVVENDDRASLGRTQNNNTPTTNNNNDIGEQR